MHKNKRKKYNSFFIVGLMVGILFSVTGVYAVTQYASNTVYYINKNSGLSSNNVQGAIDELATIHKPGNNDCPSGYVCTKNSDVYTINLNASFGISDSTDLNAGTVKIYLMKDDGIYLDRGYTKKMTTTENPITIPTVTGYTFKGYYNDNNEMLINENGYITSSFTNNKFSKTSTINAKWEANNYEITLNTNKPSPLKDGYYTNGTNTVYMKYGTGVYLDDAYTNKMTTSDNAVTKPTATGYNFLGYYDGDTQMIDANGRITSSFTDSKYSDEKTLAAKWKRNFTCNAGDTNVQYAGKSWTTVAKYTNDDWCELVGNFTTKVSGSYNDTKIDSTNSGVLDKSFFETSGKDYNETMSNEYKAGLYFQFTGSTMSYINSNYGTVARLKEYGTTNATSQPTGVYWVDGSTVYDSTDRYKYTCNNTKVYYGITVRTTSNNNITSQTRCTSTSKALLDSGKTHSNNNGNNYITYTATSASNQGNAYGSIYFTSIKPTSGTDENVAFYYRRFNYSGTNPTGTVHRFGLTINQCGTSTISGVTEGNGSFVSHLTAESSTTYMDFSKHLDIAGASNSHQKYKFTANRYFNYAAVSVWSGKSGDDEELNFGKNSTCVNYANYKLSNTTVNTIYYRPHIKVKMNT